MKTPYDSDEDPSDFLAEFHRLRAKSGGFAKQLYSPDYIEIYPWDTFDPSYANKLDLAFAALPPAEQFLRLPKCIVENTDNHLSEDNVVKMLTWLGDHGKAGDSEYTYKVWDTQSRAWGIAKRFNRTLDRRREKLIKELGEEEVQRLREVEKEQRRGRKIEKRRKEEEERKKREEANKRREETKRKREEEEEEGREKREEIKKRRTDEEHGDGEVVELGAIPRAEPLAPRTRTYEECLERSERRLIERLDANFEDVKTRIVALESMRETGNYNKTYLTDFTKDVGERVEGSIHKAVTPTTKSPRYKKVVSQRLMEATVRGVIGVLEYVYLPVELKVAAGAEEEQLRVMEASDDLRAYGAKKKLGDLLFKFFFKTEIDQVQLVHWLKSESDLHRKLGMLLGKMTQAGMDRTMMQNIGWPFGIKL
ncbi:hypothetical protein B0T20DRAFT_425162 [Sordaria brevicollis]|uniref:Uncharacterized protein n=1 Tax=Sordaria brevicollis TaxID=83679 RepID=A0AAE0U395_SORBR|nr:hypothetical protein B0T20DRAFT_425162 [Sordaria brevicollis]